jgi:ORF6N domain
MSSRQPFVQQIGAQFSWSYLQGPRIITLHSQKVMLDRDLAELCQVKPIALRQQVKRNRNRFPDDFMFRLTQEEADRLVSQNVIPSKRSLGGFLPYAFTEQGVAMLSGVLNSDRAIAVNIAIMRAFVRLREIPWPLTRICPASRQKWKRSMTSNSASS